MNGNNSKHLLMIVHRIPYPPDKGDKIRSYHQFCFLKAKGWKIHLCTFIDDPNDLIHTDWIETQCETSAFFRIRKIGRYFAMLGAFIRGKPLSIGAFYSPRAMQYIQDVLSDYPIKSILCFSSPTAEYLFQSEFEWPNYCTVMDMIDVDSDKWRLYAQSAGYPRHWVYASETRRLAMYEKKITRAFDAVTLVSESEALLLRDRTGETHKIRSIPNGVDVRFFHPSPESNALERNQITLVFCGLMDYYPNVDAVVWFVNTVMPALRTRLNKPEFYIVGARPAKQVLDLARSAGVRVLGRVDDVRPFIWEAAISVAPLRIARGIQNKVLEAMAMAKPIVATQQAFEGIEAVPGRDLIVTRDEPQAFAEAIITLWENRDRARKMGEKAREAAVSKYDWNARLLDLHQLLARAATDRRPNNNSID